MTKIGKLPAPVPFPVTELMSLNSGSTFLGKSRTGVTFERVVNQYPESLDLFLYADSAETVRYWVEKFKDGHSTVLNSGRGKWQLWDGNHRLVAAAIAGIETLPVVFTDESVPDFDPEWYANDSDT